MNKLIVVLGIMDRSVILLATAEYNFQVVLLRYCTIIHMDRWLTVGFSIEISPTVQFGPQNGVVERSP